MICRQQLQLFIVQNGECGTKLAAQWYGVPQSTLKGYLKKGITRKPLGRSSVLGEASELELECAVCCCLVLPTDSSNSSNLDDHVPVQTWLDIEEDFGPNGMITDCVVLCIFCSESFKSNTANEQRILCTKRTCKGWAHVACTDIGTDMINYVSDFCWE